MKFNLRCNKNEYQKIKSIVENNNIEITKEPADFIIISQENNVIKCRNEQEIKLIDLHDVLYIQSIGRYNFLIISNGEYKTELSLNMIDELNVEYLLRISRSCIVNLNFIKKIHPSLNMKFNLLMINDEIVTVTRSYYKIFKNRIGL